MAHDSTTGDPADIYETRSAARFLEFFGRFQANTGHEVAGVFTKEGEINRAHQLNKLKNRSPSPLMNPGEFIGTYPHQTKSGAVQWMATSSGWY
ncbi:MAG: hypothetical protein KAI73_07980 [Rhodospirillaceae bacterium]|nr:hypothetical protein [Rhodospirillaceae bacterium]